MCSRVSVFTVSEGIADNDSDSSVMLFGYEMRKIPLKDNNHLEINNMATTSKGVPACTKTFNDLNKMPTTIL